jgi:hypothetical protein
VCSVFLRTKTITISFIGALNTGAHPTNSSRVGYAAFSCAPKRLQSHSLVRSTPEHTLLIRPA